MDDNGMIYPAHLEIGKKYAWFMGAETLECTYLGRGGKLHFSYRFQLNKSEHELSYSDVRKYIGDYETFIYNNKN